MSVSSILGVPIANIAKVNGVPIANIKSWNGEEISTAANVPFTMEYVIPSDSLSLTLPLNSGNGSTFNCVVDWGDSSTSTITAVDDPDRIHNYASAGTYTVTITGTCEGWSFSDTGDRLKLTKIISFGSGASFAGFKDLAAGFHGCSNLTTLGSDPIKQSGSGVTNFNYCFYGCTSLTSLPTDLFRDNTSATTFTYCFYGCTSLTSLPTDFFRYNTNATGFYYCFNGCTSLTLRSDIFYPSGGQSTRFLNQFINFRNCFYRSSFTGTQGTAPDLWNCNFGTGTPTRTICFGGPGNSTTSISNYNDIQSEWK